MQISGFTKRSISDQVNTVDFDFTATFSNTTGFAEFGLSGSNVFKFTCKSGKIYDTSGNFVQSYEVNTPVLFSGQVGQTTYDYYINSNLIAFGAPHSAGLYSWIFANGNFDFQSNIRGSLPSYTLDQASRYPYPNASVTGRIVNTNSNISFRIFSAEIAQNTSPYTITGYTTGNITGPAYLYLTSTGFGLSDYIVPIVLHTNFGDIPFNFTITGDYSIVPEVYLNISPSTTNVIHNSAKNYIIQVSNFPSGTRVGVSLEYSTGITGKIYFFQSQVSELRSGVLSGTITGSGVLGTVATGIVSGLDPKTNIYETATGTGIFTTSMLYATGDVSGNYSIKVYGLASGQFNLNYSASGSGYGYYSGIVPIQGAVLDTIGYNIPGTGNVPVFATGVIPTGYGSTFVFPTGCISISGGLAYGVGFYSGIVAAPKVYQGLISYPYSIRGVGYATGTNITGIVDSNFGVNFEQGLYDFWKYFSGLVRGTMLNTGNFNPNTCNVISGISSGILTGIFHNLTSLDCSFLAGNEPVIYLSGIPSILVDSNRNVLSNHTVVMIRPSGGFPSEDSDIAQTGFTRTKTSRMGATTSGTGYFTNIVGGCLSGILTGKVWSETMATSSRTGRFDSSGNSYGEISMTTYLTGSGTTGFLDTATDYAAIHFQITGAGTKAIAFRGLNVEVEERVLQFYLYKNGLLETKWEGLYIPDNMLPYSAEALTNATSADTIGLEDLGSGDYSLIITARELVKPVVEFLSGTYSGCESSQNILIKVAAHGVFRDPCCVNLNTYTEITAHSGVNYDPILLQYDNADIIENTTCTQLGAGGAKLCPGICFEAAYDGYSGYLYEEREYFFTIPIYDNAAYGLNHEFTISLSNPSGCTLGSQATATVQIVENDNSGLMLSTGTLQATPTGAFLSGIQFLSGVQIDCSPFPPYPPPPPDPCIFNPFLCDPCYLYPEFCNKCSDFGANRLVENCDHENCTGVGCGDLSCVPSNTQYTCVQCPGRPQVCGPVVPYNAFCGQATAQGCGETNGYIFVGEICCSGCAFSETFDGGGCYIHSTLAFAKNCGTHTDENGVCQPCDAGSPSGCTGTTAGSFNCSGECGVGGCGNSTSYEHCTNYAKPKKRHAHNPKGPDNAPLMVFLEVRAIFQDACDDFNNDFGNCVPPPPPSLAVVELCSKEPTNPLCRARTAHCCNHCYDGGCAPWGFTGVCKGVGAVSQLCGPRRPR